MYKNKHYRIMLITALVIDLMVLAAVYAADMYGTLPGTMYAHVGDAADFDFPLPIETVIVNNKSPEGNIHYSEPGKYIVDVKLFGLFNIKQIAVDAIEDMSVIPCGNAIGISIDIDGLLVLGTGKVRGTDGKDHEPAYNILQTGDYITGINGESVDSIALLQSRINKCNSNKVELDIRRNDENSRISIPVISCDDNYKRIGVWVREDTRGIGTLTCITQDGEFSALGHGVTDSDSGVLLKLENGEIYNTEIIKIVKGSTGKPGEIMGMILESEEEKIGSIRDNTPLGIKGRVKKDYHKPDYRYDYMPIGLRGDVKKGPAKILCQLGDSIEEYDIRIDDVWPGSNDNKGMVLKITDRKLLEESGGIIQGMSGAPIIQNGKVIGAVTHVFVNDPTRGYGIFLENMLGSSK